MRGAKTDPTYLDDTYWTLQRAATYGDCHPNFIRKQAAQGRLRLYRMGTRAIRVKRSEVETLFQAIPTAGAGGEDVA